jgi:integrase
MKDIYGYINTLKSNFETKTPEPLTDDQMYAALDKLKNFGIELLMKICLIICIAGSLRISMCHDLKFSEVKLNEAKGIYDITVKTKKRKKKHLESGNIFHNFFVFIDLGNNHNFKTYLELYFAELDILKIEKKGNFFKQWRKGKKSEIYNWSSTNMSSNTISDFSKEISKIIGMDDWEDRTSKIFKRTSLTLAAENGATDQQLQQIGQHKNPKTSKVNC